MRHRLAGIVVAAIGIGAAAAAIAQTIGPQNPPLVIRSLVGKDSFEFYCAPCHGRDGSGHGPTADRLKTQPPDLRLLARRNGGEFPHDRILAFVTNGDPAASEHQPGEMLPWGRAFTELERSDAQVKIRIANIVEYVETLQVK